MFYAKLRHSGRVFTDESGNTLMLIAGMFLPILAMVGSGIDISRAYLTKARLQSACDAGVLAARKVQIGTALTSDASDMGARYFIANFGSGSFGSYDTAFEMDIEGQGQINGVAVTKLDTGVMQVFGQERFEMDVNCSAIRDLSHTDVMFVLDTTGSMLNTNSGDTLNRFETMKDAVVDFHGILEATRTADVKLRYGFVPYSEMVNVGGILPSEMMVDDWTYQSRKPDGTTTEKTTHSYQQNFRQVAGPTPVTTTSTFAPNTVWVPPTAGDEFSGGSGGYWRNDCNTPPNSLNIFDQNVLSTRSEPFAGPPKGTRTIETIRETWDGRSYSASFNGSLCVMTTTDHNGAIYEFDRISEPREEIRYKYHYKPIKYDVSDLISGGVGSTMTAPIGNSHEDRTVTWFGCIEERDTERTDEFDPIPKDAHDLDIDTKPHDNDTRWRPAMPELIFRRPLVDDEKTEARYANLADSWGGAQRMCPSPAKRLAPMNASELDVYLDTLQAKGGTHHDIGILWGARLISPSGIFSSANSGPQTRHIIFMTDGQVETNIYSQDSYGHPWLDRRRQPNPDIDPTNVQMNALVEKRFLAICTAARARGITIWSIAFGTELSAAMQACAGPKRAFEADNAAELDHTFKQIANGIARLRLIK